MRSSWKFFQRHWSTHRGSNKICRNHVTVSWPTSDDFMRAQNQAMVWRNAYECLRIIEVPARSVDYILPYLNFQPCGNGIEMWWFRTKKKLFLCDCAKFMKVASRWFHLMPETIRGDAGNVANHSWGARQCVSVSNRIMISPFCEYRTMHLWKQDDLLYNIYEYMCFIIRYYKILAHLIESILFIIF